MRLKVETLLVVKCNKTGEFRSIKDCFKCPNFGELVSEKGKLYLYCDEK